MKQSQKRKLKLLIKLYTISLNKIKKGGDEMVKEKLRDTLSEEDKNTYDELKVYIYRNLGSLRDNFDIDIFTDKAFKIFTEDENSTFNSCFYTVLNSPWLLNDFV